MSSMAERSEGHLRRHCKGCTVAGASWEEAFEIGTICRCDIQYFLYEEREG